MDGQYPFPSITWERKTQTFPPKMFSQKPVKKQTVVKDTLDDKGNSRCSETRHQSQKRTDLPPQNIPLTASRFPGETRKSVRCSRRSLLSFRL